MITENLPEKLAAQISMLHNFAICVGVFIVFSMGALLPDADDVQGNKDDEMWRVIFIFPTIQGIVTLALILLVFTEEPIGYCIMRGFNEMGMRHM